MPSPIAQLLILNPNTSESVSQTLLGIAQQEAHGRCAVRVQTARLGASYISDEISFAIAGHALLDAYAADVALHPEQPADAVLIGCFGDPGLLALQQLCPVPVLGLAQASIAAAHGRGPYAIVTGGQAWVPMLQRLVAQLGLQDRLLAIKAVDKTGAQLAADVDLAVKELAQLCVEIAHENPALQSIVLGGAALGGLAQPIEQALAERGWKELSLLDSVRTSVSQAIDAARLAVAQPPVKPRFQPHTTLNLSLPLENMLRQRSDRT